MTRPVKLLTISLWALAVLGLMGVVALQLASRRRQTAQANDTTVGNIPAPDGAPVLVPESGPPRPLGISAPPFSLTDQLSRTVTSDSLRGHPWISDFIFTECASACPQMSHRLAEMQKQVPASVMFVSFSVDPEHDTPAVLKGYGEEFGADNDRWRFLTGDKKAVYAAVEGLKTAIIPADKDNPLRHDVHFMLFDAKGHVCGIYDSQSPSEVERLVKDANTIAADNQGGHT